MNDSYHYHVIGRAIAEIDRAQAAGEGLPGLEALAAAQGMSAAHFQRLFSAWVGVSPKRYGQYLALDAAKAALAARHTTLEAAEAAGLTGAGRLHDLLVTWEAMSPGEFARAAAGLTIYWAWGESPYGPALTMATERGICGLAFAAESGADEAYRDLAARWPGAHFVEDPARVAPLTDAAFARPEAARLHLMGGPFQIKVWEALLAIPEGHVATYSDLARAVGHPAATRAVGTAVGRNPVSLLIPCHRALRKSGALGGYHWGLPVKRAILAREAARVEAGVAG